MNRPLPHPHRWPAVAIFGVIVGALVAHYAVTGDVSVSIYGVAVLFLLTAKLGASLAHRPADDEPAAQEATRHLTTALVVPVYNEDPAMLARCLDSIAGQTQPPTTVVVVDDGSATDDAYQCALGFAAAFAAAGVAYTVYRAPYNGGKRQALGFGFRRWPTADLYLCVDSDTLLAPNALARLRLPFMDPRVTGATGLVLASNRRRNVLTRLIDLRYAAAFLAERAAYSRLGAVLCCCGSLSAYRGHVVREHLGDFLTQTFLGQPAVFGDDRRLTNYALLTGRVVLQETAVAWTAVPERLGHYRRQQVRWNKSFWRESLWAVRNLPMNRPAFWLSLLEVTTWATFTIMLTVAVLIEPVRSGLAVLITYGLYLSMLAYARSVRYFEAPAMPGEPHTCGEQALVFALAPLYGLMHLVMLLPLRFWALATLRSGSWGTRQTVEITVNRSGETAWYPVDDLAVEAETSGQTRQLAETTGGQR